MNECLFVLLLNGIEYKSKGKSFKDLKNLYKNNGGNMDNALKFKANNSEIIITDIKSFQMFYTNNTQQKITFEPIIENMGTFKSSQPKKSQKLNLSNKAKSMKNKIDQKASQIEKLICELEKRQSINDKLTKLEQLCNANLLKVNQASSNPKINVIHQGIKCSHCGAYPIQGYRYQCTIEGCNINPNLCMKCFDDNEINEFDCHEFIEIREPVKGEANLLLVESSITIPKGDKYTYQLKIINKSSVPIPSPIKAQCASLSTIKFLESTSDQTINSVGVNNIYIIPITFKIKGRKEGNYSTFIKLVDTNDTSLMKKDLEFNLNIISNDPRKKAPKAPKGKVTSPQERKTVEYQPPSNPQTIIQSNNPKYQPPSNPQTIIQSNKREYQSNESNRPNYQMNNYGPPEMHKSPNASYYPQTNNTSNLNTQNKFYSPPMNQNENFNDIPKSNRDQIQQPEIQMKYANLDTNLKSNYFNEETFFDNAEEDDDEDSNEFSSFQTNIKNPNKKGKNTKTKIDLNKDSTIPQNASRPEYDAFSHNRREIKSTDNSSLFTNNDAYDPSEDQEEDDDNRQMNIKRQELKQGLRAVGFKRWISDQMLDSALEKYTDQDQQIKYIQNAFNIK